jgi:hypothetical protein
VGFDLKNALKATGSVFKAGYFWLEKIAIAIGVMGGLKGAADLWQTWHPSYDLEIERSAPVTLTYDARQKDLILAVGLILTNRGTTSDAIERSTADLRLATDSSQHCAFGNLNITFKEGANQIPRNLPIQKDGSRSVTCEISAHMSHELRGMFQLHETRRELVITLFGHGQKPYPVRFAFDFGEGVAKTLFDPSKKEPQPLTFLGSDLQ